MEELSIRTIIKNMIEDFSNVSNGLLDITNNEMYAVNAEKAVYGKVYGKPSARLATLLSIDREALILFSGYSKQQMRTINTVCTIIKNSSGRLEPTVAIVVHCDNQGNAKLKKNGGEKMVYQFSLFIITRINSQKQLKSLKTCFVGNSFHMIHLTLLGLFQMINIFMAGGLKRRIWQGNFKWDK